MVIKCEYREEEPEKDKDKEDGKPTEKKEDEAGGDDEDKKTKTQMFKYVRAFLPQWLKDHDENRQIYEAKMEVKMIAAAEKRDTKLSLFDDDDGKAEQTVKKQKKVKWLEENNILIVSDNRCKILCVIVKGIQGEQHKVFMFNTTKHEALITSSRAGNTDLEFNMNSHIRDEEMIFIC